MFTEPFDKTWSEWDQEDEWVDPEERALLPSPGTRNAAGFQEKTFYRKRGGPDYIDRLFKQRLKAAEAEIQEWKRKNPKWRGKLYNGCRRKPLEPQ